MSLQGLFATVDAQYRRLREWLHRPQGVRIALFTLLSVHTGLLAYSATRHGPTQLEPAFLASGISHWQLGRYDFYRVNPPLPRMIAAIPVLVAGCETDWSRSSNAPGNRAEFDLGEDFVKANGPHSVPLLIYSRWAGIPFSLLGGYFAFRWASELYSVAAGLLTLVLWTFEPNLLAHAELVTPDGACWSLGVVAGYYFWRWLLTPTWPLAVLAGGALGIAELTKTTWLMLFGLWPLMWCLWIRGNGHQPDVQHSSDLGSGAQTALAGHSPAQDARARPPFRQLTAILVLALYVLNLGYLFDGSFTRLKEYTFVSALLNGMQEPGAPGNRFCNTWLGEIPIPAPKQYLLGVDAQQKDFEAYGQPSFLRGEWKLGGWWYYYIYGLLVKVPCGVWGLSLLIVLRRGYQRVFPTKFRTTIPGEYVVWLPALCLIVIASSQTEFNHHLRYVYPSLALGLVLLGQAAVLEAATPPRSDRMPDSSDSLFSISTVFRALNSSARPLQLILIAEAACSGLTIYPHHLAYFNAFVGGPENGPKHLVHSSFDWGQDNLLLRDWYMQHRRPPVTRLVVCQAAWSNNSEAERSLWGHLASGDHPEVVFLSRQSPLPYLRDASTILAVSEYRFLIRPDSLIDSFSTNGLQRIDKVGLTTALYAPAADNVAAVTPVHPPD